jgi:hypothetical protein
MIQAFHYSEKSNSGSTSPTARNEPIAPAVGAVAEAAAAAGLTVYSSIAAAAVDQMPHLSFLAQPVETEHTTPTFS